MKTKKCPFCNIDKNKIIKETDYCYIIYDEYPVSLGHMLIIPKRHVSDCGDLTAKEYEDVRKCINFCRYQNDHDHNPDGYNIGVNIGESAGQTVMHCHIHVIPRYKGDVKDPRGGVRGVIPDRQKYNIKPKKDPEILNYKICCFEYIVSGFIQWYDEWNKLNPNNKIKESYRDYFRKIRINKLLFFLSAINEKDDLLDIFDNFYAAQWGPVEDDIAYASSYKLFKSIQFEGTNLNIMPAPKGYFDLIKKEDKLKIDNSFEKLKEINFELIYYSAFDLVKMSMMWSSWSINREFAKFEGISSIHMDKKNIREDSVKMFKIQTGFDFID